MTNSSFTLTCSGCQEVPTHVKRVYLNADKYLSVICEQCWSVFWNIWCNFLAKTNIETIHFSHNKPDFTYGYMCQWLLICCLDSLIYPCMQESMFKSICMAVFLKSRKRLHTVSFESNNGRKQKQIHHLS